MLLETSGCGAVLNLDQIPCPKELSLERWLISFPSFGFLLSVRPGNASAVQSYFSEQSLICEVVGEVQPTQQLLLRTHQEYIFFWALSQQKLTGFSKVEGTR